MNTRLSTMALSVALAFGAGSASAELARVGPIDRANGYPAWYQDKTGLTLDFCQNQSAAEMAGGWCVLLPPDVPSGSGPETFPNNFADEHFYWLANAGDRRAVVPGSNQTVVAQLVLALEGAFGGGAVLAGDQMVFARLRIRLNPIPFDGTYTVYTPFGKFEFANQVAGDRLFSTEDIGITPGAFAEALKGRIGPFLLPSATPGGTEVPPIPDLQPGQDPFHDILVNTGAATAYPGNGRRYVADPARVGPLTGSPIADYIVAGGGTRNANIFRIEGPNGFVYETTDFTVSGRVFEGAIAGMATVDRASYQRTATNRQVDVYATATPTLQARLPAGTPSATVSTELAYFDAPCTPSVDAEGNFVPPYSAPANAVANQMLNTDTRYYGQSRPATIPTDVCIQANAINSGGQATTAYMPAQLGDQVTISEALYDPNTQALSVKAKSSDLLVQQTLRVEGFDTPLDANGQLVVNEVLAPPSKVVVISSGRGLNEMQVSSGAVTGGGSTLPVANNDTLTVLEDSGATIVKVLLNDNNVNGGTVAISSPATLGTTAVNADGSVSYTPRLNANGTDRFGYKVTVNGKVSNEGSVAVTVTPVNDPPVAVADSTSALRGTQSNFNVLANDTDPDGVTDLASAVIVTGNANLGLTAGTTFNGGIVSFTPSASMATGTVTFTYNAVDRAGMTSATPATVSVAVSAGEAIVGTRARFVQSKNRWTITGTDSLSAGQTITIKYDNGTFRQNGSCALPGSAAGTVVGTAVVSGGAWTYDQALTATTGILNPSNTGNNNFWCTPPTTLRMTSSQSPATATLAIEVK